MRKVSFTGEITLSTGVQDAKQHWLISRWNMMSMIAPSTIFVICLKMGKVI